MTCPDCRQGDWVEILTGDGVVLDYCSVCEHFWFERGELAYFSDRPQEVAAFFQSDLAVSTLLDVECPNCEIPLQQGDLSGTGVAVIRCPDCRGLWLNVETLQDLTDHRDIPLVMKPEELRQQVLQQTDRTTQEPTEPDPALKTLAAQRLRLPNLALRAWSVLFLLYAILGGVLILLAELGFFSPLAALILGAVILVLQFLLSPYLTDLTMRWLYDFSWVEPEELPEHLREFIERTTGEQNVKFPHVGLIHDGSPNCFTYGHHPNNMRIVLTQGILDLLEDEEVEGVIGHEIGHGVHWDMAVMTMAQLVPLVLYYIYRTAIRVKAKKKAATAKFAVVIGAYVLYVVSQYLVLWLSRTREYHADQFSGEATGNPNHLASGLMKIAYGLASRGNRGEEEKNSSTAEAVEAMGGLGIFDPGAARSLVASAAGTTRSAQKTSKDKLKGAMQWDLWNPWATFYELHSTHPLVAKRILNLSDQATVKGLDPFVVFDRQQPESYWDEFLVDVLVLFTPFILPLLVGVNLAIWTPDSLTRSLGWGIILATFGAGMLLRTVFTYPMGDFPDRSVSALLHKVEVSRVRPVPVHLEGTIIGRGVPGLIWSEDFVLQDESGIIFLDYRQPLAIIEWLFGLLRAAEYKQRKVEITGWYRRSPIPYVELHTLNDGNKTRRCYVYPMKLVFSTLVILGGIGLAFYSAPFPVPDLILTAGSLFS